MHVGERDCRCHRLQRRRVVPRQASSLTLAVPAVCSVVRGYVAVMKPIQVGLVADPASPTEIARRISDLESPGGEDRDAWDIEVVSEPFTTGSRGRRHRDGAAGGPRSPARLGPRGRPDRTSASRRRRPLPAGGDRPAATGRRCCRCPRSAGSGCTREPVTQCARSSAAWPTPTSQDEHRVPLPRATGRWRLLLGMVLANRPWLLVPGLKSALVAALATGAVATINSTVWLLAGSLSWWRLTVATVASIALVVAWLVIDGELWDRPDDDSAAGAGEVPSVQHLDVGDPDHRGAHLLSRALRREPGLGAVRPRPRRDGRLPQRVPRLQRPFRAGLVRRVGGDRRRRTRHRPGVGRSDPRGRVLQARGGAPQPARPRTDREGEPPQTLADAGRRQPNRIEERKDS